MEMISKALHVKQSPKKIRLVASEVKNMNVHDAITKLSFINKKSARLISSVLKSALSNLNNIESEDSIDKSKFFIKSIKIDKGSVMKRFRPAAMGRAAPILKRSSHIEIKISDLLEKRR